MFRGNERFSEKERENAASLLRGAVRARSKMKSHRLHEGRGEGGRARASSRRKFSQIRRARAREIDYVVRAAAERNSSTHLPEDREEEEEEGEK